MDGGGGGDAGTFYALTVISDRSGGSIVSTPAGIDCGSSCSSTFPPGAQVDVTVMYAPIGCADSGGSKGFSGAACSGAPASCSVTMAADTTVYMNWMCQQAVTIVRAGTGTGTVTSTHTTPPGVSAATDLNCGATCMTYFWDESVVTLTATATSPSTFTGWSGAGCSGTGTCVFTVSSDVTITANFSP